MDLSSKDFTLNFRGFEHDDPETVQRFTAFCEANFALSPEKVDLLRSAPETIVLTQGGSLEELEALAKVLREIGAVVDVSEHSPDDIASLVAGPTTQELHRLFGPQSKSSNDDAPLSCPYPPPLGRSLYLFSNTNPIVDRKALRQISRKEPAQPGDASLSPTTDRRDRTFLVISCGMLGLGLAALTASAFLIQREGALESRPPERSVVQSRDSAIDRHESLPSTVGSARTLSSSQTTAGFTVALKILANAQDVSVSSLSLTPLNVDSTGGIATVKRIVGEPTFLERISNGEWRGTVILSVSREENGNTSHSAVPASITVRINDEQRTAQAVIEVTSTEGDPNALIPRIELRLT